MKFGIKDSILNLETNSYAKEHNLPENLSSYIDCSNGINPFGVSKEVEKSFNCIPLELINKYPKQSSELKKSIKEYWSNINHIDENQILLGAGSIELIYKINKLFIDSNSKVLGYSPQFSDFIDDIKSNGGTYESYLMNIENNYKFDSDKYLDMMNKDYKLFYIDNPNNPTGQVIDINYIDAIVKKAKHLGLPVIIDEAYGDFISKSNSAITLLNTYDNLIVMRTFSKGLGLAGIRAGYLITSNAIAEQYCKISNPFEVTGIARFLATAAMRDREFVLNCKKEIIDIKKRFIDSLNNLVVLETNLSVPIMTLMHPNKNVDLEDLLLKHHIISVSGRGFYGLGKNFVRIMINPEIDVLISTFGLIDSNISY